MYETIKFYAAIATLKICRVKFKHGKNHAFFNHLFQITCV